MASGGKNGKVGNDERETLQARTYGYGVSKLEAIETPDQSDRVTRGGATWLRDGLAILGVTLLGLLGIEAAAYAYLRASQHSLPPLLASLTDDDLRKLYATAQPEKYREVMKEGWGVGYSDEYVPFLEFKMRAYQGKWVNITGQGFRENASGNPRDAKSAAGPKIFVFGGSTALGLGVADGETIAAYLEQEYRDRGVSANVFNFGVSAYYSTQEVMLFEKLLREGFRPDVVVFVDGLNDFFYCKIPDETNLSPVIARALNNAGLGNFAATVAQYSNVVRALRYLSGETSLLWDGGGGGFCPGDEQLERVVERLSSNRRIAHAIAAQFGIQAVFVQQPVPTFHYDNSRRPIPWPNEALVYHVNSGKGYALMQSMRDKRAIYDKNLLWLADLSIEKNMYVDTVHYSPAMNQAIARAIFEGRP